MTAPSGPYRARIEAELRERLAAARADRESPPPAVDQASHGESPLALRCTACGCVNSYRARGCTGCHAPFNAEIVWLPSTAAGTEPLR